MSTPALGAQRHHFEALAQGRFELPCCSACGRVHWPPRVVCPRCMGTAFQWAPVSGQGVVQSATTVRRKADAGGDIGVCLIDLAEGPRMLSRVEGLAPDAVRIGLRVRLRALQPGADALPVFEPETLHGGDA